MTADAGRTAGDVTVAVVLSTELSWVTYPLERFVMARMAALIRQGKKVCVSRGR